MTRKSLSIAEVGAEVEKLGEALATSGGDPVNLKAAFVARLAELEASAPDLVHVENELDRLTTEAARLAFGATPEQAAELVRGLADIHVPYKRLTALGNLVTRAAACLADTDVP